MNHVKYKHKVTCLSAGFYEESEIKQVIASGIGRPKNVQLARVNWVTIKPRTGNRFGRALACTTAINETVGDLNGKSLLLALLMIGTTI